MRVFVILSRHRMSYGDKIANTSGGCTYMREVKGTHWTIKILEGGCSLKEIRKLFQSQAGTE